MTHDACGRVLEIFTDRDTSVLVECCRPCKHFQILTGRKAPPPEFDAPSNRRKHGIRPCRGYDATPCPDSAPSSSIFSVRCETCNKLNRRIVGTRRRLEWVARKRATREATG